ncbi:uncharacterized protein LOC133906113 isoform X3 [Phragmites australis]|uniref:uncharacterized protein LOC133906113 isoform X3 n=1 Tax=Phragmites australis TaxID=29695 RepID=UPI002D78B3C0|nr:uncharacterized protein LOC133906113 isoform X3 [Phragmites australis]
MCPLRVILIFLSATIAGFFLIRGLNAEPDQFDADADADDDKASESGSPRAPVPLHSKSKQDSGQWWTWQVDGTFGGPLLHRRQNLNLTGPGDGCS